MSGQKSARKQEQSVENPNTFNDWLGLPPDYENKNPADCPETPSNVIAKSRQVAADTADLPDAEKVRRDALFSSSAFVAKLKEAAKELPEETRAPWLEKAVESAAELCNPQSVQSVAPAPRLKWGQDNAPDENPAVFAWQAYQAEAQAGTLHRGVILHNDDSLYRALRYWLKSNPMPEGIDIPTKPEWNTRQIEAGKARPAPPQRTEGQRLYDVERARIRKWHRTQLAL